MGRLANSWAGKVITQRIPYIMAGEITRLPNLTGQVFPEATFTHNIDMPFEAHRMKPAITGIIDAGAISGVQPPQEQLLALVRAQIDRIGGTIKWTKVPTLLRQMVKGSTEQTWELAEPDTIVKSEGWAITCDILPMPVFATPLLQLRIEIAFEGFLLQLGPPSEQR